MSVAEHFDTLSIYRATAVRIFPVEGEPEDLLVEGGGLADQFEILGQRSLVGILRDGKIRRVILADGDLQVQVTREDAGARLSVIWGDDTVVDSLVEIPPLLAAWPGPWFRPDPATEVRAVSVELDALEKPLYAVADMGGQIRWFTAGLHGSGVGQLALRGTIPALQPGVLGSAAFREAHGVKWTYVAGAMAGAISSVALVVAMANAGLLAFYGSGGVPVAAVEEALQQVKDGAGDGAWGFNLLHNPVEPAVEEATVDLYLEYGVRRVSASAYMGLTAAVARYRLTGITRGEYGAIQCPNRVFAKVSRPEVAEKFLRPAPDAMIADLVKAGHLSPNEAELARLVPIAEDITCEGDSGGHTDHRPLMVVLPAIQSLRDQISAEQDYNARGIFPRVGAAGGLGTPAAIWGAYAMGADYVLTGSVNQATQEAGTSDIAKEMLTQAKFYDVASGPAPDMFEIGAKVQVLSRGSMYAQRSQRLHDIYKRYDSMEAIPAKDRARIEKQMFKANLDEIWAGTESYWQQRDPKQVEKAHRDGRHKMALTFRWYLGMTSRWARLGDKDRKRDFQLWCGPAMGGFNEWALGTELEPLANRKVAVVAEALMRGAAAHGRVCAGRSQGIPMPAAS
ncbi:MAG: PfaD family polyunsaturated fatty acid/polyketide biosynthesis protein [Rhodobacterales bacterium]|nr:PfaD family polyunsaturated fatty acid/polyketide biosynthesis protein [Rhodobacterales bacterium]